MDRTITLWDIKTAQKQRTLSGHADVVMSVALSLDGKFMVSGSEDRNVMVWNISGILADDDYHVAEVKPKTPSLPGKDTTFQKEAVSQKPVIFAPELSYEVSVEDSNGNGILEGGETVTVIVNVENGGKGSAQAVEVLLSGNDTLISCLGNKGAVGNMEPNSKKKVLLKCTLPTRLKPETAQLSVELNEQRGYSPAEIKSFTVALKPAEIKETTQELSRIVDVDTIPSKNPGYKKENSYAIIVGISHYRDDIIPGVKYAESDAKIVAKYIENIGGVPRQNIKILTNEEGTIGDLTSYFEEWLPRRVNRTPGYSSTMQGTGRPTLRTMRHI